MLNYAVIYSQSPVCATPGADGAQNFPSPNNSFFPGAFSNITIAEGATSLTLDPIPAPFAVGGILYNFGSYQISKGDLLLIIQMQGAEINTEDNNKYGSGSGNGTTAGGGSGYTNLNNVGRYEYVVALNNVSTAGGTLNFKGSGPTGGLLYKYENAAATATQGQKRYQVVRLMQYSNLKLTADITTTPWNGRAGGLIAIDVAGELDFNNHVIDASMTGFRGGYMPSRAIATNDRSLYRTTDAAFAATKGEGVAGTPRYMWDGYNQVDSGASWQGYPNGDYGRGAPANAGGGGNNHNAGGGGGGNGGIGGAGGYGWNSNGSEDETLTGGRPGSTLPTNLGFIFMGGGGGGGDANNATTGVKGGVGGGIIIITAGKIKGNGVLLANGGRGEAGAYGSSADGAGGGGAGGTIFIKVESSSPGATLNIQAKGGNGGHSFTTTPHGPGGGGGGGVIHYYASGATISTNVTKGANGLINDGNLVNGVLVNNGATNGADGISNNYNPANLPPYLNSNSASCYPLMTIVKSRQNPGTQIPAGSTVTYDILITNTGGGADGVIITDILPLGFNFVSATIDYSTSLGNPTLINNIGSATTPSFGYFNISTSSYAIIKMKVNVPASTPAGTYHNGIQVGYLDPTRNIDQPNRIIYPSVNALPGQETTYSFNNTNVGGSNYGISDIGEEVIVEKPDVSIEKTIDSNCVLPGGNTYSIRLVNLGSVGLTNIVVTDILDSDLQVVGTPSGTGWSVSNAGNTYTLTLNTLAAGVTSAPLNIKVQPLGGSTHTSWINTATVPTTIGTGSSSVVLYAKPSAATASVTTFPGVTCDNGVFYINGNVPTVGTGKWEIVQPYTGNAYFEDAFQPNTRVLNLNLNETVKVVWVITNGDNACQAISSPPLTLKRVSLAPTATISGGGELCSGSLITAAQNITISLTGRGPWKVTYLNAVGTQVVVNTGASEATAHNYIFTPTQAGVYKIVAVDDANPCLGTFSGLAEVKFKVLSTANGTMNYSGGIICHGTSPTPITLTGHTGTIIGWEYSTNNIAWTAIPGTAGQSSYQPGALIKPKNYYRVRIDQDANGSLACYFPPNVVTISVKKCNLITNPMIYQKKK